MYEIALIVSLLSISQIVVRKSSYAIPVKGGFALLHHVGGSKQCLYQGFLLFAVMLTFVICTHVIY